MIEEYKGIEIFLEITKYGKYYRAPMLSTKKVPVNFTPTLRELKKFIDRELQ